MLWLVIGLKCKLPKYGIIRFPPYILFEFMSSTVWRLNFVSKLVVVEFPEFCALLQFADNCENCENIIRLEFTDPRIDR